MPNHGWGHPRDGARIMPKNRRRRKLIEPRLQLKFVGLFLTTSVVGIAFQLVVLNFMLSRAATALPSDGGALLAMIPRVLFDTFLITAGMLIPFTLIVGIRSTFTIIGPLYRFRVFLKQVGRGQQSEPCRIREGDELQDLCALLNDVTLPLREDVVVDPAHGGRRQSEADEEVVPIFGEVRKAG
jgi:hypothetical protein